MLTRTFQEKPNEHEMMGGYKTQQRTSTCSSFKVMHTKKTSIEATGE